MNVVIVESAAKAQTINKYLGRDFQVIACYGHVRDLPQKMALSILKMISQCYGKWMLREPSASQPLPTL